MGIITNSGIKMMAKVVIDKDLIIIGTNPDGEGPIRVCEDGENIMEFPSWNAYDEWLKENRPDRYCPDNDYTLRVKGTFTSKSPAIYEQSIFNPPV